MTFSIQDRMLAVLGGMATTAGMVCVLQLGGNRLAWKHASHMNQAAPEENPMLYLTPWINVPLRPPAVLSGSIILSVVTKALAYPNHKPVSGLIPFMSETGIWQTGLVIFAVASYQHYVTYALPPRPLASCCFSPVNLF